MTPNGSPSQPETRVGGASSGVRSFIYTGGLWGLGLMLVRVLPVWLTKGLCVMAGEIHFRVQRQRRQVVIENLLPACSGDRALAQHTARRLYRRFAAKLVDLWRVEGGVPVRKWLTNPGEMEVIREAWKRGGGVLLVTPHLGNWEHGGLLLATIGIQLTVLTLAEPDDALTRVRADSRARWGIETLILGRDGFALVEAIKRLEAGAVMAVAIDRPPDHNAVFVDLFGRPFAVSLAAAELARASGCALIGVTVVRRPEGYAVRVFPEFKYERQALGNREARRLLAQRIMQTFEPEIRRNLDQWYQFVAVWPKGV